VRKYAEGGQERKEPEEANDGPTDLFGEPLPARQQKLFGSMDGSGLLVAQVAGPDDLESRLRVPESEQGNGHNNDGSPKVRGFIREPQRQHHFQPHLPERMPRCEAHQLNYPVLVRDIF
jgi:hypothetical protein